MDFYIGQIFETEYPVEAADWCNENNARIIELPAVEGAETRQFKIIAVVPPHTREVRVFAKDLIWVATKDLPFVLPDGTSTSAWAAFEQFLVTSDLWTGWMQQAYLLEENPYFEEFYPAAIGAFGQDLVDEVLAAATIETKTILVEE